MFQPSIEPTTKTVEQVLKDFNDAEKLEHSCAREWPAVRERYGSGTVIAIREFIRVALLQLEENTKSNLLRERYLLNRSIEDLANNVYSTDTSTLHRWRNNDIKELQVIICEHNRVAHRRIRVQRFMKQGPLVGIDHLVEYFVAHIGDQDAAGVIVLEGMGGLGKTTIARQIAKRISDDGNFYDVLWTSAQQIEFDTWAGERRERPNPAGVAESRPRPNPAMRTEDLLGQLADELGLDRSVGAADLHTNVVAWCKRQPYLIVFDNLESVDDMSALAPLIKELVGVSRIVITTREHTTAALPAEIQRRYHAITELNREQGINLLRLAASHVGASTMHSADVADLSSIYDITGGNPLALWLVAGQSDSQPWRLFLQAFIDQNRRKKSVNDMYRYLYERSWKLLSNDARQVLLAMLRFEHGTDYDALHMLSFLDSEPFQDAVKELHHRMLLLFDGADTLFIHRLTYSFLRRGIMEWE